MFITGHTDTVANVGFSFDGALLATADMKGLIKVWKMDSGSEIWSFETSDIEVKIKYIIIYQNYNR